MAETHWWDVAGGVAAGLTVLTATVWKPYRTWLDRHIETRFKAHSFPQVRQLTELRTEMDNLSHAFQLRSDRDELTRRHLTETLARMERGQGALDTKLDVTHDSVLTLQERVTNETASIRREQERVAKNLQELRDSQQAAINLKAAQGA